MLVENMLGNRGLVLATALVSIQNIYEVDRY